MPKYTSVLFQRSPTPISSMLTPEEYGTHPHVRSALLGRDAVVLRGSHRELTQAVLAGELAQPGEPRPRRLGVVGGGRHRRQAAHVVPEVRLELLRLDARLRLLSRQ